MNKLYIIHFTLKNGYIISTWTTWTQKAALEKIRKNPEWSYDIVEDNEIHTIWSAT